MGAVLDDIADVVSLVTYPSYLLLQSGCPPAIAGLYGAMGAFRLLGFLFKWFPMVKAPSGRMYFSGLCTPHAAFLVHALCLVGAISQVWGQFIVILLAVALVNRDVRDPKYVHTFVRGRGCSPDLARDRCCRAW